MSRLPVASDTGNPSRSLTYRTVAMTTAVQTLTAFSVFVFPVLAPAVASDLGVAAASLGGLMSVVFLAATVSGLLSGVFAARVGPVSTLRNSVLLVAIAFLVGAGGHFALAILFSVIVGFAHGAVNPVSSTVLSQAVPANQRSLMFSIKQTGVPLGSAIAGVLLPAMLLVMDWRLALLCLSGVALCLLPMLRPFVREFDIHRRPDQKISLAGVGDAFKLIWADPRLVQLTIVSAIFALVQLVITTFMVSYLHLELHFSLVVSGLVLSATSAASVFGRIFWGWIADRTGGSRQVLAVMGLLMGVGCIGGGNFSPAWPLWAVVAVGALWGISAVAWNGVLLAEVARLAPEGKIAAVTSGVQAIFFVGSILGPIGFGAFAQVVGGFGLGYLIVAPLPLICGIVMLLPRRKP